VNIFLKKLFIPVIKAEFAASLLQSSLSHDPSEITLIWWSDADYHVENIVKNVSDFSVLISLKKILQALHL